MRISSLLCLTLICLLCFTTCTPKSIDHTKGIQTFVSIRNFGTYGDGRHNDQPAIQRAFRSGSNLYFPKGKYLLKTKTDHQSLLLITEQGTPRKLKFAKGAVLVVSPEQPADYIKPAVIRVIAKKRSIPYIEFDGLSIEGNRQKHKVHNAGLVVLDQPGTEVQQLVLKNVSIRNVGWNAIHTQAMNNEFYNIRTENSGLHGIGIINYSHKNKIGKFFLDGHTSINDDGYSIDFSGPKDENGVPFEGYAWKGEAKNIKSFGSRFGIKTAGHWDLILENISVENSDNHGFFINVDAPGQKIRAHHFILKNNLGNALNLRGITDFEGEDIYIENCGKGMLDNQSNIHIKDLTIIAGPMSKLGIQIGGEVETAVIDGFELSGFRPPVQYPVRIKGKNVTLKNGVLKNNISVFEVLLYPEARKVRLERIRFEGNKDKKVVINGVRTLQKQGSLVIKDVNFQLNGIPVRGDRTKIKLIHPMGRKNIQIKP